MNVVIVEDEQHTALLLKQIIEKNPDFKVSHIIESVADAVAFFSSAPNAADLLFFDIQLADGKSFEIFRHVDITIPVIFCTAFDDYSLTAIQNNGINYILKPFREEEIQGALTKYIKLFRSAHAPGALHLSLPGTAAYQQTFLTHFRGRTLVKRVEDIALFAIENEVVYLYTYKGERFPVFKNMEYIQSVCNPHRFYRVNRKILVNRDAIVQIEPCENRKITLWLSITEPVGIIVSRLKVTEFKRWLNS